MGKLKPGDWVVYRKPKTSTAPGPRAKNVVAARHGETYSYVVDKYWAVKSLEDESMLLLSTRTGKEHLVATGDPNLRPARWWERWLLASRFPAADRSTSLLAGRTEV